MTSLDEPTLEMDVGTEADDSIIGQLRARAKEQQEEHTIDIAVGGEFKKQLLIRYKPLDPGPMDKFFARRSHVMDDPTGNLPITELNMDLMAQACVGVYGADVNGENKEQLTGPQGQALKLDYRLIEFLQIPVTSDLQLTSYEVIMLLFGNNAMTLINHGDQLTKWMQDPAAVGDVGEL